MVFIKEHTFYENHNKWFIDINAEYMNKYAMSDVFDNSIADIIKIPLTQYIEILVSYNAFEYRDSYWFKNAEDCQKCVDYLNETYGILLALE